MVSLSAIRLVGVAAGFLTSVLAARVLGAAEFGVGGVAVALGTLVALIANAGLSMSIIYLLRRRPDETRRLVDALTGLALVSVAVAALLGVCVALAAGAVGVPGVAATAIATGVLAAAMVAVEASGARLLGLGASGAYTITEGIRAIGILVASAAAILIVGTAAGYVGGVAFGLLTATAYALWRGARLTRWPRPRADLPVWRTAVAYGLRGQVGNVLQYLTLRLDLVLVAAILGAAPAGIYLVATRVSEVVTQIASAASALLFPAVAVHGAGADTSFTAATVRVVTLLAVVAAVVLAVAASWLLPLVFGAEYAAGVAASWFLLAAAVPLSVGRLLAGDLKGRGRPGLVSAAALIGMVILVVGDLAVLETWGITGAAVVSLIAYGSTAVALALAYRAVTGASLGALVPRWVDVTSMARQGGQLARRSAVPAGSSVSRTPDGGRPPDPD